MAGIVLIVEHYRHYKHGNVFSFVQSIDRSKDSRSVGQTHFQGNIIGREVIEHFHQKPRVEANLHIIPLVGAGKSFFGLVAVIHILCGDIQFSTGNFQTNLVRGLVGENGNPTHRTQELVS